MKRHSFLLVLQWLIVFYIILTFTFGYCSGAQTTKPVSGIVKDHNGIPVAGAWVAPLFGSQVRPGVQTDSEGRFTINVNTNIYSIIVYADDSSTEGYDYVPVEIRLSEVDPANVVVSLQPAGSVKLSGVIQFVEYESLAENVIYSILNDRGEVIYRSLLRIPGLDTASLIVPIGAKYIKVDFIFKTSKPNQFVLKTLNFTVPDQILQGDLHKYDLARFTIPWNRAYVDSYLDSTKTQLTTLQENRFYLAKESLMITDSESKLMQSESSYQENDYTQSYVALKNAFIKIRQVNQTLEMLRSEAFRSIYIILFFFAASSIIVGYVIFEVKTVIFLTGIGLYSISSIILYTVYPGVTLVTFNMYLLEASVAIILAILLTIIFPKIFSYGVAKGESSFRAISQPIFTLAKRLLKRRPTRNILTILSISLLTMSFVTLTSLSEEYGISFNKVLFSSAKGRGMMISSAIQSNTTEYLHLSNDEYDWLSRLPGVKIIAPKYVNSPQKISLTTIYAGNRNKPINGVVGIDSALETQATNIEDALAEGKLPGVGEIVISLDLKNSLNLKLGDSVTLKDVNLIISGVVDDSFIRSCKELDGSFYLPTKMMLVAVTRLEEIYAQVVCDPNEVVIVDFHLAAEYTGVNPLRLALSLDESTNIDALAERIALESGFRTTASSENGVYTYVLGTYLEGKGLPLLIPWSIVVLSVVTTMVNSLYERRREIKIISAVGLNPSHITGIFLIEGLLIGLVAGGLGYLVGLSLYRVMDFIGLAFNVEQKVSALWSLASVGLAASAVLVGAFVALKSSVIITPSLSRKWILPGLKSREKPFEIVIPVKLNEDQFEGFINHVSDSLKRFEVGDFSVTSMVKVLSEENKRIIQFIYKSVYGGPGSFYSRNRLVIDLDDHCEYRVTLFVVGESDWAYRSGSLIRKIVIEWSDREKK